jgi:alpha-glucosidase (family GH31 glycosyl hydrolase)
LRLARTVLLAALALAAPAGDAQAAQIVDAGPLKGRASERLQVRVVRAGRGVTAVHLRAPAGAKSVAISFPAARRELFTGFGERSNAVDQRGREVIDYTADGPFLERDRAIAGAVVPDWAELDRPDATYYPVPWLLSNRGYGVLVDNDETSRFRLAGRRWTVQVEARRLDLRVFAGPRPADALRRFTAATGRQPAPPAPWAYGPWIQTGQPNVVPLEEEARIVRTLRAADAPVSAAETQMHFLPCGAQRSREAYELARTRQFHAAGLAHMAYFNPHLCTSYEPVFTEAAAAGALQRTAGGEPLTFPAFVGGEGSAGFTIEPLAQFDFSAPAARRIYARLLGEAVDQGKDGWMEDFGEWTKSARIHNRYPRDYHCAVRDIVRRFHRPLVRFQRSGWTGAARCSVDVWGGDPTTVWGFDGLRSAVTQALTIGMSGVARWGSDIGGYNSFGEGERLTPELLERWIQLGAVSGVMRTKRSGIAIPAYERPQVFDPGILGVWRRYAKLHTQLLPYIQAADATYRTNGLPLMRHGLLTNPGDPRAVRADDQFMFGPDLLAAPVLAPGATRRRLYLPAGRWIDLWRSARYATGPGALRLGSARVLRGRRSLTLPAPRSELPLLVRAGAVIPLLPADVDTLAPYRGPGVVRLADRLDRVQLLAFPRGRSSAGMGARPELLSSLEGDHAWRLTIRGKRARRYSLQASLAALRRPFVPRSLTIDGRPAHAWSYDRRTRVLRATFKLRSGTVTIR